MNIREQFGTYLLLKKLGEDPLGETFRAGRIGGQGMEQVVLMKVFNGPGIDGTTLWGEMESRQRLQEELASPNIGVGVDVGEVRNTPYAAYDYISGEDLASLQRRGAEKRNPLPTDHALLIVERLALALSVGHETPVDGQRVHHGCVVPQLVMISNEGETRLLGFTASTGLRTLIAEHGAAGELARYLSPEARAGQPLAKTDDVYSLGAILFELLTDTPLATEPGGHPAAIEQARLRADDAPLPEGIRRLLARTLTGTDERIGDVVSWHESISELMYEGDFSPTTFNLAFYMHNLFREEIEKESQEIEAEKSEEIPALVESEAEPAADRPAATAATTEDVRDETGVRTDDTGVVRDRYDIDSDETQGRRRRVLVAAAAAAVVLAGALVWFFYFQGDGTFRQTDDVASSTTAETAPMEPTPQPTKSAMEAEAGPTSEQIAAAERAAEAAAEQKALEERLAKLIEEKTEEQQAAYEEELDELRSQLQQAKERTEQAEAEREAARPEPADTAGGEETGADEMTAETAEEATVDETRADEATEVGSTETTGEPTAATVTDATEATEEPTAETTSPAAGGEAVTEAEPTARQPSSRPGDTEAEGETTASETEPATTRRPATERGQPAETETPPVEPAVQRGDLVSVGEPGVSPPNLIRMPSPRYPPIARRMRREATVNVRVLVDENGHVIDAELAGEDPGYGFAHEALAAARQARFDAATKNGVAVKTWWEVPIDFKM